MREYHIVAIKSVNEWRYLDAITEGDTLVEVRDSRYEWISRGLAHEDIKARVCGLVCPESEMQDVQVYRVDPSSDPTPPTPACREAGHTRSMIMYAYKSLAVVTLGGYGPVAEGGPGSLDWLLATYDAQTPDESRHVLAVDLDRPGHEFAVMLDQAAVGDLLEVASAHGYTHRNTRTEEAVGYFGDGVDQVAICRHPAGWIVLPA